MKGVHLVEQHAGQLGVVGVEAAVQGLDQLGVLAPEAALGHIGQYQRAPFAGDHGFEHGPARDAQDVGGHRGKLYQGVLQQFFQPVAVAGALGHQVGAQAGVVPQGADLGRGHEARP